VKPSPPRNSSWPIVTGTLLASTTAGFVYVKPGRSDGSGREDPEASGESLVVALQQSRAFRFVDDDEALRRVLVGRDLSLRDVEPPRA